MPDWLNWPNWPNWPNWIDWIGWVATAVFAGSYFCQKPVVLRRLQALAAVLWISYGIFINAVPVIVANLVVASLALWSSLRKESLETREEVRQVS
ncbi:MAG: YgjV family protein [Blastocatellia bacterium]